MLGPGFEKQPYYTAVILITDSLWTVDQSQMININMLEEEVSRFYFTSAYINHNAT